LGCLSLHHAQAQGLSLHETSPIYEVPSQKALDLTDEVTLEAWVQAGSMPQGGGRILDKSVPNTNDGYMLDTYPGNSLRFITNNGAVSYNAKLPGNKWTHIVAVYSATQRIQKIYVNGEEVASTTDGNFPKLTTTGVPLRLGIDPNGGNRFTGRIQRAAIYGRALTAQEIGGRFINQTALNGVLSEWQFASASGAVIAPVVGTLALQGGITALKFTGSAPAPKEPLSLWYRKPAEQWVEAVALGNGRLGAMVFGRVNQERIGLNEDTFYSGQPYDPTNPEALQNLPEARRLIFAGQYKAAEDLIHSKMRGKPAAQSSYQPIGDLVLSFPIEGAVSDYRRDLNLDTAIASVTYTHNGTRFTREIFTTPVDQVMVVRLTADKPGQINFSTTLRSPQKVTVFSEGSDTVVMRGDGGGAGRNNIPGALRFESRLRVLPQGGSRSATEDTLTVTGANSAVILLDAATAYKTYKDISGDPAASTQSHIARAAARPYNQLRAAHIAEHQRLFRRVALDLGTSEAAAVPTDERLRNFARGAIDLQLPTLYFQFGRYLLIASSRPGTQPANLQGIWNESTTPPWDSKYTININIEMNYWPAEPTNLSELHEPLIRMVKEMSETGARTAKVHYGAGGWVAHHNTDLWRATQPIDPAFYGMWPLGGAWLTTHLVGPLPVHRRQEVFGGSVSGDERRIAVLP
jgi:alpha-L-fucosidase 2